MKFEYSGTWIRFRLELFPSDLPIDRFRIARQRQEPAARRELLRRIKKEAELRFKPIRHEPER